MDTVQIEDVTKMFGEHTAVDSLSLTVPTGSIYGFIGPNGSGKTTTLRMIMGIFYPDMGAIRVFGNKHQGARSERIGYLPEERGLYRKMKVRELLRFYGGLKSNRSVKEEVDMWLEKLDLTKWADSKVEALSKGMSQKVQFISAVITKPELLILDEPFSGLDPVNLDVIREAVLELKAGGTTIIFSTHDMTVAETMCDFIFMIYKGKKVLDGTLTSIQASYGQDILRVNCEGERAVMSDLEGVTMIRDFGNMQELQITNDADPQKIMSTLMSRTQVNSFEITRPSLHDIFIRIADPTDEEIPDA
jgi:ABC-2 type transport system ATP-binding protein